MYKQRSNPQYATKKRFRYKKAIFQRLKNGPALKVELKKSMNVPSSEAKTFDRALNELKDIGAVTMDKKTGKLYAHGHEPPETIEINVGSPKLNLTVPVKREQAKKIIKQCPSLKKDKEASTVLKETEILEEKS